MYRQSQRVVGIDDLVHSAAPMLVPHGADTTAYPETLMANALASLSARIKQKNLLKQM
ncbi:MAG: hypothetical protein U5O16_25420 [Rhodococcus sp. (in: high G+C Gram-positive bacteria)]|uniref:hypothetical protein n=1 Tax=Rhodococcus sp. TaxID=1831 RepID=UPI002AD846B9|nr:hypothetical protein [Rhodococcus sp. (in: high G+C Gram-positive bacteria)]